MTNQETARLPETLPAHITLAFPSELTREQAGHLRHFHNLATQKDGGTWRHMEPAESGQETLEAFRYQLATMAYAAGLCHFHRLPALRSVFESLLESLIAKMLRREVWAYWYLTSQSGTFVDPDLTELRRPWADPVKRENIMFSGHLLLMVSLYAMLIDSDKYDTPGSLMMTWDPIFFGLGTEKFSYNRSSLQQAIVDEISKNSWMGACCEPNCVFVACNQFPLIALRYNDVRDGNNLTSDALQKYTEAWRTKTGSEFGVTYSSSDAKTKRLLFPYWRVKQDELIPGLTGVSGGVGMGAWAAAFMHAWNAEYVQDTYPSLLKGFLTVEADGRVSVNNGLVAQEIRQMQAECDADDENSIASAYQTRDQASLRVWEQQQRDGINKNIRHHKAATPSPMGLNSHAPSVDFGFTVQLLSEIPEMHAGRNLLQGLLQHADNRLNPTWEIGGLYYPRKDASGQVDELGTPCFGMDPYTGNSAIGYARLNVPDGQKKMWDEPWTRQGHHATYPKVDGIDLSYGVDFFRGGWSEKVGALMLTMATWDGSKKSVTLRLTNLPPGFYGVYKSGRLDHTRLVMAREDVFEFTVEAGSDKLDIVVWNTSSVALNMQ